MTKLTKEEFITSHNIIISIMPKISQAWLTLYIGHATAFILVIFTVFAVRSKRNA